MHVSRKSAALGVASGYASVLIPRWAQGEPEFSYKLGNSLESTTPTAMRAAEAIEKIKHDSNGRIDIKSYPNSVLGGDIDMLSQVRLGALEFLQLGSNFLVSVVPAAGMLGIPFVFPSYRAAWSAVDGVLGTYIRDQSAKADLYVFEKIWDASMRQVLNRNKPVLSVDDMQSMKIRVPDSPVLIAAFKALGANPTPMNYRDVYVGISTHLLDGAEMGLYVVESGKFFEVCKYASITNHAWSGNVLLANPAAWRRLPPNLRSLCERHFDAAGILQRNDMQRNDQSLATQLTSQGMAFNQADVGTFRAAIRKAGLYGQWRSSFGPEAWSALEKSAGSLS